MTITDRYAVLREKLDALDTLRITGCSDGNCRVFRDYRGMHTNGGCRCIEALSDLCLDIAAEADRVKRFCGEQPLRKMP